MFAKNDFNQSFKTHIMSVAGKKKNISSIRSILYFYVAYIYEDAKIPVRVQTARCRKMIILLLFEKYFVKVIHNEKLGSFFTK